ncbi:DUF2239 family protein [Novosphingobium sp. NBM11]|uniref:DUF2239 family protein n=1 Tax=Novosphingobium sp. NBM11 TaxID=2596914 RepID=UPI0021074F2B|nr:DUF2239 family protein [Novosphingobium sp. NBM11]
MAGDLPGYEDATRALFAGDLGHWSGISRNGQRTSGCMFCCWCALMAVRKDDGYVPPLISMCRRRPACCSSGAGLRVASSC